MNRTLLAAAMSAAFAAAAPAVLAESAVNPAETPVALAAVTAAEEPLVLAAAPAGDTGPRAGTERRALRPPSERVEARLAYLRTALKITDSQQAQWEGFSNVLRRHAQDKDQRLQKLRAEGSRHHGAPEASAIERLERAQQFMALRAQRLSEVLTAAKPLYAALSPEQQAIADELLSRRQGMHGGRRGHGGQMGPHHGGMRSGA